MCAPCWTAAAGFFVLQLFVPVTIEKFSEMHQQQGKCALLTPQQEGWLLIERMMADVNLKVRNWHNADNAAKRFAARGL